MVDKVDMSLDDIIKQSQKGGRGGIGRKFRGRGRGRGNTRGPPRVAGGGVESALRPRRNAGNIRSSFSRNQGGDIDGRWQHDMFDGYSGGRFRESSTGSAKLIISNLHYDVSDFDITELFAEFGPLKSAGVHYERSGRSLGIADVVFERRADALRAIKRYNGVPLDGRPMSVRFADGNDAPRNQRSPAQRPQRVGGFQRGRGGGRGRGMRGGRGGPRISRVTAEQLDAELDAYSKQLK